MLSSNDVAAMFAAQGQNFAQQNYFAQTVGISNPSLSIGAYRGGGLQSGFQPVGPSFPGVRAPPPVFSYASGSMFGPGYGSGNNVASMGMAGIGGAATLGGIGLGMMMPGLDPISGFMGGMRSAGGFGVRGVMGGMAGAALPLAGAMLAAHAVGSFVGGGHQQAQVSNQLGGFNFINPASRTGMGFTRQDAGDIGSSIRSLAHVPEMLTSVEELTRLLPQMRRMGVMSGVKDAAEFGRRFKETVNTIRDMSKMLGSTMEEASQFFEHNRQIGMTSKTAQLQNTLNAQFTSGMTGMTMGQTMQMQQGGAQMARQFGARGRYGAAGVTNMAQSIQGALEGGFIDQDLLTDVTGLSGSEATSAASQKMFGFMSNLSQTSAGRLIMAGTMKRGADGKVMLDEDVIKKLNQGIISVDDLKNRAGSLSDNDKISFQYHAKNLGSQFAGQVDMAKFMQGLVGNKGDDAAGLILQQYSGGQMSEADIALLQGMGKGSAGVDMESFKKIRGREMAIRERSDPEILMKRIKTKMHTAVFGGLEELGADTYTAIGKAYDEFIDDLVGRHVVTLSKDGAKAFQQALSGSGKREMNELFRAAHGLKAGSSDIGSSFGEGSIANAFRRWGSSSTSSGLTEYGKRAQAGALIGATGKTLDNILDLADSGKFITDEGRAAAAGMKRTKGRVAMAQSGDFNEMDSDKQMQLLRQGLAREMSYDIARVSPRQAMSGQGWQRPMDAEAAIMGNDIQALLSNAGVKSLEELRDKVGADTETGKRLNTFIAHRNKNGALVNDMTTAMVMSTPGMNVSGKKFAGIDVEKYVKTRDLDKMRKDADDLLTDGWTTFGLKSANKGIITGNAKVRGVVHEILNGEDKGKADALEAMVSSGEDPDAIAKALATKGFYLTADDVRDLQKVMKDPNFKQDRVKKGVGLLQGAVALGDKFIVENKMSEAAANIRAATAESKDAEANSVASALSDAMGAMGKDWTSESSKGVSGAMGKAVEAYRNAKTPEKKAAILTALGGAAGSAVQAAAASSEGLASKIGKRIKVADLDRLGFSAEEIEAASPGAIKAGETFLAPGVVQRLTGGRAATALRRSVAGEAGAAETGMAAMVESLKKISTNSDKQAAFLAVLAAGKQGEDGYKEAQAHLKKLHPNAKD